MIGRATETNNDIGTSESLISQMRNRAMYRKLLTYGMIGLILLSIIIIVWYNFFWINLLCHKI